MVGNCRGSDGNLTEKKNKKKYILFSYCFFFSKYCWSWSAEKTFSCLQALYGTQHQLNPALHPLSALEKPQDSQQYNLMVLQAGANQRSEKLICLKFSACMEALCSDKAGSGEAQMFCNLYVCSAGYLAEDESSFLLREWSGFWECCSPTSSSQAGLTAELFLAQMSCKRPSTGPDVASITGQAFWGKMMPLYQLLLNSHHCKWLQGFICGPVVTKKPCFFKLTLR